LLRPGLKVVLHARTRLELRCAVLPGQEPGQRLVLFRADPGGRTDRALAAIQPAGSPFADRSSPAAAPIRQRSPAGTP
jgi:hypothetical protein